MVDWRTTLGLCALCAAVSYVLAHGLAAVAIRCGAVDRPGGHKAHGQPTPLLGGLAVMVALVGVSAVAVVPFPTGWLVGLGIIVAVGLVDDFAPRFPWWLKLAGQIVAASFIAADPRLAPVATTPLATTLLVLWLVACCNALNLLDHGDGLCAVVGALVAAALAMVVATPLAPLAVLLAAACLGFLGRNFPPAKQFLGDGGSHAVGLALGALGAATWGTYGGTATSILALVAIFTLPFGDMLYVAISRLARGRAPYQADRNHIHHRLCQRGWSVRQATLLIYSLATALCATGLAALIWPTLHLLWFVLWLSGLALLIATACHRGDAGHGKD